MGLRDLGIYNYGFFFFLILYIRVGFGPGMPYTRTQPELVLGFHPTLMSNGSGQAGYLWVGYILPSLSLLIKG